MGLFSLKKKEQKIENLPPLRFPELPALSPLESHPSEKGAMREAAAIKEAVAPSEERSMPAKRQPMMQLPEQKPQQPLFVKVDAYNEVLDTLAVIKARLSDASHVLNELSKLKEEEDRELASWHSDLAAIKEKLMLVDQKLLE